MTRPSSSSTLAEPFFAKETLIKGQPSTLRCVKLLGSTYVVDGGIVTRVRLEDEWFEDIDDAQAVVAALKHDVATTPDLFTFWQRMPDVQARHDFHVEWEEIAVLPIQSYEHWWKHQIGPKTRNRIRKAEKEGLMVKEVPYDDEFVKGMTAIFNESPIRQGRPFWHYGKDFDTLKSQFSRHIHRERMIAAFFEGQLIGLIMLADAGRFGLTGQVISSLKHRDKSPNNALIAKAVEVCAAHGLSHLIYYHWSNDSLSDFKRHCGFLPVRVPRYWVPLTWKGRAVLALGLHKGWKARIPSVLKTRLKELRRRWYERGAT